MLKTILPFAVILFFFISLFIFVKVAGPIPFAVNSVSTTKQESFYVNGEGKVSVVPDVVVVNAGITSNGASVKVVQDQINATVTKVSTAVKGLGVDEKDIKTSNYNINPTYDYSTPTQKITGYTGSTSLEIKVRDTDKANSVVDAATSSGANQINGITFEVSDKTKAENQAREIAIKDAKSKAESAAKIGGFQLGRMINYQESFMQPQYPMPYAADAKLQMERSATEPAVAPTQIETGSSELTLTVTISYEIR